MDQETVESAGSRAGDEAGSVFQRGQEAQSFDSFKESLPDGLGKDKAFEPITSLEGMAKGFVNAEKLVGSSIRLPGADLSEEDRATAVGELKSKLMEAGIIEGVPETAEGYQYERPTLGDGLRWDEGFEKEFVGFAHEASLTNSQVQKAIEWWNNRQAVVHGRARDFHKASVETLKKEWGADFERKAVLAKRAAEELGGDEFVEMLEKTKLGDHPTFVKVFAQVGDILAEDGFISGRVEGAPDMGEVMTKINALMNDKEHPLWDVAKPGHKEAVEGWTKLQQQLIATQNRG